VDKLHSIPLNARGERRAMVALVAVFVLLVQALFPAMAMATTAPTAGQVICTDHGLQTVQPGDAAPAKGSPARGCDHCVCPPAAIAPPAIIGQVHFVAYALDESPEVAFPDLPPPARAPPRPPGQGPPFLNA